MRAKYFNKQFRDLDPSAFSKEELEKSLTPEMRRKFQLPHANLESAYWLIVTSTVVYGY